MQWPIGPSAVRTEVGGEDDLGLTPGTILFKQWQLVRELGRGGFGAVFEARELNLDQIQAVKVLYPSMVTSEEHLLRFRREVLAMRSLAHAHIGRVYDYREDLDQDLALISMELVSTGTVRLLLEAAKARGEPVPLPLIWSILEQMLLALAEAHHQGIMHRDVAPGNVLLAGGDPEELLADPDVDPRVKLVDFGIAGLLEERTLAEGRPLGTVAYMAPEVVAKQDVTPAADVYGAGAVVYELVTGEPPLGRFERPAVLRSDVSSTLDQLLLKLLERRPSDRPSLDIALAVCAELGRPGTSKILVNRSRTPTAAVEIAPANSEPRWSTAVRALGWAAVVLLAVSLGFFLNEIGSADARARQGGEPPQVAAAIDRSVIDRVATEAPPTETAVDTRSRNGERPPVATPASTGVDTESAAPGGLQVSETKDSESPIAAASRGEIPEGAAISNGALHQPGTHPPGDHQSANGDSPPVLGRRAKLEVHSVPPRAFVYLDGKFVGRSPLVYSVAAGNYKVEVMGAGCERSERPLVASAGSSYSFDFELRCLDEVMPRSVASTRTIPVAMSREPVSREPSRPQGSESSPVARSSEFEPSEFEPSGVEPPVIESPEGESSTTPPSTDPPAVEPSTAGPPVSASLPASKWRPFGGRGTTLVESELGIRFVYLTAGDFVMGSAFGEAGRSAEETQHPVALTRPFWIGETEVTQHQWSRLMGENPSQYVECGEDCPVENVTWLETLHFANALSKASGFEECYRFDACDPQAEAGDDCLQIAFDGLDCNGFRLPTEAEWEYAARAGTTGAFAGGDLGGLAWFRGNAEACTHPVGRKAANPWGLRDMHGNVWEWVWDAWGTLPAERVADPLGPEGVHDASRVYRGGSIECVRSGFGRFGCRSASREKGPPDERVADVGVRLVRTAEPGR